MSTWLRTRRMSVNGPDIMAEQYDVMLAGSYFCDMVFTGLPELPQVGRDIYSRGFEIVPGGSYYTAVALHYLGVKTGWMGHIGTDLFSRFILDAVASEGIDTALFQRHDHPVRRIAAAFSFEHDRGFVSYIDEIDETIPVTLIEQHQPRCVILHGLQFLDQVDNLSQLSNRSNFTLFLDCQDTALTLDSPGVVEKLRQVDIFAPNADEALKITGAPTVEKALNRLAELVPLVVIKCGKRGALAQRGDEFIESPALDVTVVDTTGAGDCFNAGFVYGYLRQEPLATCVRYGNTVGGQSTTAPGALALAGLRLI